jgi:hypothetical protein
MTPELTPEQEGQKQQREAATRLFAEDWWPPLRVWRWLAFREPARIEDNWQAERRYTQDGEAWRKAPYAGILSDTNPKETLLEALRDGKIKAYAKGKALPRKIWHERSSRGHWTDVEFRRGDVLAVWPKRKPWLNPDLAWLAEAPDLSEVDLPLRRLSPKHAAELVVPYQDTTATPTREGFVREWSSQFRRGSTTVLRKVYDEHRNGLFRRKRGRPSMKSQPGVADKTQVPDTN